MRKKLIAGNWKMNGNLESLREIHEIKKTCSGKNCEVALCPPSTLLTEANKILVKTEIKLGAQNCNEKSNGAHTGEISAQMLRNLGVELVILGHSERRAQNFENNKLIKLKANSAIDAGLACIICTGETEAQKRGSLTEQTVSEQLKESLPDNFNHNNTIIAYEPVWAIGSGKTPTQQEIAAVHGKIRSLIASFGSTDESYKTKIIYGGSVTGANASSILQVDNVDGALVGGASLREKDFSQIVEAI